MEITFSLGWEWVWPGWSVGDREHSRSSAGALQHDLHHWWEGAWVLRCKSLPFPVALSLNLDRAFPTFCGLWSDMTVLPSVTCPHHGSKCLLAFDLASKALDSKVWSAFRLYFLSQCLLSGSNHNHLPLSPENSQAPSCLRTFKHAVLGPGILPPTPPMTPVSV